MQYQNFQPSKQDIRRAIEQHGREISATKLLEALTPLAKANGFKFVDYPFLKLQLAAMVRDADLERIKQTRGFYRYSLWV